MSAPLLGLVARLLFLPLIVVSIAFVVKGYGSPGGGFAGGVIASLAVLLQRLVFGFRETRTLVGDAARRRMLGAGFLLAFGTALAPMFAGRPFLTHYPAPGQHVVALGTLELHTSVLFEAGVYLIVFAFVLEVVHLVASDGRRAEAQP